MTDTAAVVEFDGSGGLSAAVQLAGIATFAIAGAGALSASTRSAQVASLSVAASGRLNINPRNDKPAVLTIAVTAAFAAHAVNIKAAFLTAAGASSFTLNTRSAQMGRAPFFGAGALFADGAFGLFPTINITGELVLIGNQPSEKLIPSDAIATKDTRYVYIGFGRVISGKPTLNFISSHAVASTVNYPIPQIGTRDVFNHQKFFPARTYIKSPIDVTRMQTAAGVWSVAAYTMEAFLPAGNTPQYFYVSVED